MWEAREQELKKIPNRVYILRVYNQLESLILTIDNIIP